MSVHLRPATDERLGELLVRCAGQQLTYSPVGGSLGGTIPDGLVLRTWSTAIPGDDAFDKAAELLRTWGVHRGSGLKVKADGPVEVGTNVAMSAGVLVAHVDITCRIVQVLDEPGRFGFAYGTLPVHPECGEESFVVDRDTNMFTIQAVSRAVHPLARLVPPIADRLQAAATGRYLAAMIHGTR